jgi:hypothetical protein
MNCGTEGAGKHQKLFIYFFFVRKRQRKQNEITARRLRIGIAFSGCSEIELEELFCVFSIRELKSCRDWQASTLSQYFYIH